jgi:hypothetical protein
MSVRQMSVSKGNTFDRQRDQSVVRVAAFGE